MHDADAPRSVYIGPDRQPHFDEEARKRLAAANDAAWISPGEGIVRVPTERWREAQAYERGTWMEDAAHAIEDRNAEHAAGFHDYAALRGRHFVSGLELGCGPFTNLRLIARSCRVERATLLDPLLPEYLRHRHCAYRHGWLRTGDTVRSERWGRHLPGRVLRRILRPIAPQWFAEGLPVAERLACPIETMPDRGFFDLVVMINVLEHCYDARAIFRRIHAITRPGSIFVFHDKMYDAPEVAAHAQERYDAGHPLRIDGAVLRAELLAAFHPLHEASGEHVEDYHGVDLTEKVLYFIGERR